MILSDLVRATQLFNSGAKTEFNLYVHYAFVAVSFFRFDIKSFFTYQSDTIKVLHPKILLPLACVPRPTQLPAIFLLSIFMHAVLHSRKDTFLQNCLKSK